MTPELTRRSVSTTVELETTAVPVPEPTARPITAPGLTGEPPGRDQRCRTPGTVRRQAHHGDAGWRRRAPHPRSRRPRLRLHGTTRLPTGGPQRLRTADRRDRYVTRCAGKPVGDAARHRRDADPHRRSSRDRDRPTPLHTLVHPADAHLSDGTLALDIIGTGDTLETGQLEIIVTGLDLQDPVCNVGTAGAVGGCTLPAAEASTGPWSAPCFPAKASRSAGRSRRRTDRSTFPSPPCRLDGDLANRRLRRGTARMARRGEPGVSGHVCVRLVASLADGHWIIAGPSEWSHEEPESSFQPVGSAIAATIGLGLDGCEPGRGRALRSRRRCGRRGCAISLRP